MPQAQAVPAEPTGGRPCPPATVFDPDARPFTPDPDCETWIRATFLDPDGPLHNPEHEHLRAALIGVLWTTMPASRHMMTIIGQAEVPTFQGGKWVKGRQEQQLHEWFGVLPDFVLTFDAHFAAGCDDATWCAVVEHELYHCGQAKDEFGAPKFKRNGMPVFGMRGHDVEEFVGVVRRYGVGAAAGRTRELVEAAAAPPTVAAASIAGACGTCRRSF